MSTDSASSVLVREITGRDPSRWAAAWQVRARHHAPVIRFDRPLNTLPVSLTGTACALGCAHCNGHYLQHMRPIAELTDTPATSLLVSGGCDRNGRVPVEASLEAVARLATGRRLNWHVGQIDEPTMQRIAPYVDLVSYDIVGDAETSREVYGLDLDLPDYLRTYDMLRRNVRTVPHVTLGLRGGRMSGEAAAIDALVSRSPRTLVFLVLIPTPRTRYAECTPPALDDVADLLLMARVRLPRTRLYVGCMRPRDAYREELDVLAVRAGVNVIVNPARQAVQTAESLGLTVEWGDECCALD